MRLLWDFLWSFSLMSSLKTLGQKAPTTGQAGSVQMWHTSDVHVSRDLCGNIVYTTQSAIVGSRAFLESHHDSLHIGQSGARTRYFCILQNLVGSSTVVLNVL